MEWLVQSRPRTKDKLKTYSQDKDIRIGLVRKKKFRVPTFYLATGIMYISVEE